jgi:hypothetical protein
LKRIQAWRKCLTGFLFPAESDDWLAALRFGLAAQILLYGFSISRDWNYLLAGHGGLISRNLSEAMLSLESPVVPRLGWLVSLGAAIGLTEHAVLSLVWWTLIAAACFLFLGIFCRPAAIITWLLHLVTVKSGSLVSYGVDNLTTIGLFYLMLSPLPDRYSLDARWRRLPDKDQHLLGFWRRVLQTQVCLIYFFGGVAKCVGTGWWDGANLWRALIRPPFNLISADVLIRFKYVFPVAGIAICILEIGYPFAIWDDRLRRPWLVAILLMHLGIGFAMGMYLFATVMIILNLAAFGPGILWFNESGPELPVTRRLASVPGD